MPCVEDAAGLPFCREAPSSNQDVESPLGRRATRTVVAADQQIPGGGMPDSVAEFPDRDLLETIEAVLVKNLLLLVDRHQKAKVGLISPVLQQPRLDVA